MTPTRPKILTSTTSSHCLLLALVVLLISTSGPSNGQQQSLSAVSSMQQVGGELSSPLLQDAGASLLQSSPIMSLTGTGTSTSQPKQVEILVQPNTAVRIECRLPPLVAQSNKSRTYYWNFQRTLQQGQKPDLLCYGPNPTNKATSYGIELDFDPTSGTYDLVINNATYELNDGIYYCDYEDAALDSRQTFNREFRLTVLIPPQAPTIAYPAGMPAREGQDYQLSCTSSGGNPEPNITWYKNNEQQLVAGGGVRIEQLRQNGTTTSLLSWTPTVDDHQATFKCSVTNKAMNGMAPLERDYSLQVEYAPRIQLGPYNPLKVMQGDRVTLSCQVDANPAVKAIRWLKDGHQMISNQYNYTIHEVKLSDASVYSCQADNGIAPPLLGPASALIGTAGGANGSPTGSSFFSYLGLTSSAAAYGQPDGTQSKTIVEARLQLEVLYAPRVRIQESRAQPLSEGADYTLNCTVDSWPPAYEFVWTKQEDASGTAFRRLPTSSSPTLEFQSISASDMGNYTCTAYNRLEPSFVSSSSASTGQGVGQQQQQVFERQGSASHMVLVRHKPGLAEIVLGQNGETELGNQTSIQCRVKPPGYPEPKYTFWKWTSSGSGSKGKSYLTNRGVHNNREPVYTMFAAQLEDEARYGCMAQNELGPSSEANGELIVNEAPKFAVDKLLHNEDSRQPGYSPYSITVRATGKPEPRLTWFHRSPVDGRRIDLSSPEMAAKFRIDTHIKPETQPQQGRHQLQQPDSQLGRPRYTVFSTLTFKQALEIDDRGLYSVEASNGLSHTAIQFHKLHINHAPIPALRNMPIVASQPSKSSSTSSSSSSSPTSSGGGAVTSVRAGFNLGEMVNLTCRVSAYPQPEFVWHSQASMEKALESDSRYRQTVVNVEDDIWESTMSFELSSEADYGDYMCVTANQDAQTQAVSDSTRILIHLNRKMPPEAPLQVEQIDATQDSVTLQWIPGFDGGYAQNQFLVQYAPDDNTGLSLMTRYGPLIAADQQQQQLQSNGIDNRDLQQQQQQQMSYPKLYDCLSMNPCTINNLQPRQAYLMRVRARNELGSSKFTDDLRVSTRANMSLVPRIQEAHFDATKNILRFRVEPNPEYLLNNLEARIEVRGPTGPVANSNTGNVNSPFDQTTGAIYSQGSSAADHNQEAPLTAAAPTSEWRRHLSVPIRNEQGEAYLNMQPDSEQLRLTLCSRLNDSLCGPEFVLSTQSVTSSFLQDQRGLSISILASTLVLIIVLGGFATTLHSCCVSRKAKKVSSLDHVDSSSNHRQQQQPDNKPTLTGHVNGGLSLANGYAPPTATVNVNGVNKIGSHGSTTSTNSTSAANGVGANGQLHSMDSISNNNTNNLHLGASNGSASDHSSDHSRQAKQDLVLPPNYSHYADRGSLLLEQQQQQQQLENQFQQQQQQQAVYLQDKLGSPFGLPSNGLLHPHQIDPTIGDFFGTGMAAHYDPSTGTVVSSLEQQLDEQQQHHQNNQMMLNSVMGSSLYDPTGQLDNGQASLYSTGAHQQQQQLVDDYNNYNQALANYASQQRDQMLELSAGVMPPSPQVSASGGGGLMMAQPTQASYDNNANQSYYHQSYSSPSNFDQQHQQQQQQQLDSNNSQYQQDLAAAQKQIYGTLTRNNKNNNNNNSSSNNNNNSNTNVTNGSSATPGQHDQYMASAGLMPAPPPPPPQGNQLESDYGTTGTGRNGRLIREIIV